MKFCQVIEYNMTNTSPKTFSKKPKFNISLNQQYEVLYNLFLFYVQVKDRHDILKPMWWSLAFTSYKAFLKKRALELGSRSHLLHNFWRKIFRTLYHINLPSFIVCLPLLLKILRNLCIRSQKLTLALLSSCFST